MTPNDPDKNPDLNEHPLDQPHTHEMRLQTETRMPFRPISFNIEDDPVIKSAKPFQKNFLSLTSNHSSFAKYLQQDLLSFTPDLIAMKPSSSNVDAYTTALSLIETPIFTPTGSVVGSFDGLEVDPDNKELQYIYFSYA